MKSNITGKASISIHAPVEKVWAAITEPKIIKQYFFNTDTHSDWKKGSPITFTGEWQGKTYEDKGTILDIERNHLLRFSYWSSMSGIEDKPENYVNVIYSLLAQGENTVLTITQENIPDEKMKAHSESNWNMVLSNMKKLLEENPNLTYHQ